MQSAQVTPSAGNTPSNAPDDVKNADSKTIAQYTNNAPSKPESAPEQSGRMQYNNNLSNAEIEFDYIQADRFFPLSFDANGKVIEAAFIQTKVDKAKERVFIRLEYHKLEKRTVTVQNLAFESTDMSLANSNNIKTATNLGRAIALTEVPEWASLQPTTVIEGVDRLLFAYFRMPEANTVDPYSPLGVSGYSRVVKLIKDADMQYSRLLWEYEAGEMAIDVDRDALKFMTDPQGEGYTVLPEKQQRLFRKVDLNTEDTYQVFAPTLRDVSIVHGLNTIFMRIEDSTGLSRGTLSDVNTQEAKTATELKILKQRSYATNADIQMALQDALSDVVYVMDVYATLYEVTPPGEYEVSFEWDDSIIVDSESELSKRITLMQNGLASKLETRMWYFGETENQARAAMLQIEKESTQAMMQNVQAEQMKAAAFGGNTAPEDEEEATGGEGDNTKSPADTTSAKVSKGKQADDLDNPVKGKNNPNKKH
jgi:A118 family predicted phage portal protein